MLIRRYGLDQSSMKGAFLRTLVRLYRAWRHLMQGDIWYLMQHVVEEMIRLAGIPIVIREDERLLRKAEPRRTRGSFAKLKEQTGWLPTISLSRTLQETVRYWRKRLDRESH